MDPFLFLRELPDENNIVQLHDAPPLLMQQHQHPIGDANRDRTLATPQEKALWSFVQDMKKACHEKDVFQWDCYFLSNAVGEVDEKGAMEDYEMERDPNVSVELSELRRRKKIQNLRNQNPELTQELFFQCLEVRSFLIQYAFYLIEHNAPSITILHIIGNKNASAEFLALVELLEVQNRQLFGSTYATVPQMKIQLQEIDTRIFNIVTIYKQGYMLANVHTEMKDDVPYVIDKSAYGRIMEYLNDDPIADIAQLAQQYRIRPPRLEWYVLVAQACRASSYGDAYLLAPRPSSTDYVEAFQGSIHQAVRETLSELTPLFPNTNLGQFLSESSRINRVFSAKLISLTYFLKRIENQKSQLVKHVLKWLQAQRTVMLTHFINQQSGLGSQSWIY